MPDIKSVLADLNKQIEATLNPPAVTSMSADEFTAYAKEQVAKLEGDTPERRKERATALKAAIAEAQSKFEKGDEKVEIVKFADPAPEQPAVATPPAPPAAPEPPAPPAGDVNKGAEPPAPGGIFWPQDLNDPRWRQEYATDPAKK